MRNILYILLLTLVTSFFWGCAIQVDNLKLDTDHDNIILRAEIHDKSMLGSPTFNDHNYNTFKNLCRKNNVKCEKSSLQQKNRFTGELETRAVIILKCKGFEKANALMSDFKSTWSNCDVDFSFIEDGGNNVVRLGFNQYRFTNNSLIEINNSSEIKYWPSDNTKNLTVFNSTSNHITYQIVQDSLTQDIVELKYEYNSRKDFLDMSKEDWTFICTIVGGIAALIGIFQIFSKFKIVKRNPS